MKLKRLKSSHYSTMDCKNGAFLPMSCANTRNTADAVVRGVIPLEGAIFAGSIKTVVAAPPQWAETHSLIRYPSPYGRSCTFWCRPPFFRLNEMAYPDRRGIAQSTVPGVIGFDRRKGMAFYPATPGQRTQWGSNRCISPSFSYCRSWRLPASVRAVTRWASRRLSAQGPVRAPRLCLMAASPVARLSARRAMSPIARPIHAAANLNQRPVAGATDLIRTTGASACAGGFLLQIPRVTRRGQELIEGTRDV